MMIVAAVWLIGFILLFAYGLYEALNQEASTPEQLGGFAVLVLSPFWMLLAVALIIDLIIPWRPK